MTEASAPHAWWKEAVVYQIYPRSFCDSNSDGIGDLRGITEKLNYLAELGVDVLWLCPIYRSPNADNGYDISDYGQIMDEFGTMDDFRTLLDSAHRLGFRLIMDLVVNHTSDCHPWFAESRASRNSPKRNWYIWRDGLAGKEPNGLRSVFSGSAWKYDKETGAYYLHLFSERQPDLNWEEPEVRDAVFAMMTRWFDRGIDGFRMDTISLISKPAALTLPDGRPKQAGDAANGPHVHEYLKEMNRRVLRGRDIMTVGETGGVTIPEARKYAGFGEDELNMVFSFDIAEMQNDPIVGKWRYKPFSLPEFKRIASAWIDGLEGRAWNSVYFDNHDQPRALSRYCNYKNDAQRIMAAKMLNTLLLTLGGTPYLYQGDELGMANYPFESVEECRDVEILNAHRELVLEKHLLSEEEFLQGVRTAGRDNARTPMQWTGDPNGGFTDGKPWLPVNPDCRHFNAAAEMADDGSVFRYTSRLLRLRKSHPVFIYGSYSLLLPDHPSLYVFERRLGSIRALVVCSFSSERLPVPVPAPSDTALLISNRTGPSGKDLEAFEARIYLTRSSI